MTEANPCILVIDDEDDVCQIIRERFEPLGYKVVTAADGAEGFRKTREHKPDCILLDILIPQGDDGLTYLRKLRFFQHEDLQEQARIRKIPVIILTGTGQKMRPLFEYEGISDYIEKPFDLAALQNRVERILRKR